MDASRRDRGAPGSRRRRSTLADVASLAGVSIAAASYVVNQRPGVGDEIRKRVLAAADELNFRPNLLARSLRRGKSGVMGLLLADLGNPFYTEIAAGAIDAAAGLGYQVFLSQTAERLEVRCSEVEALRDHRCDGLIFTDLTNQDRLLLDELLAARVPLVQAVREVSGIGADHVGIDDQQGGHDIVDHLIGLGYRRFGVLTGPQASSSSFRRFAGVRMSLAQAHIPLPRQCWAEGDLTRDCGYDLTYDMLTQSTRPQVLVCGNDMIALGAIDRVVDMGLKVPDDVAVVGFDDMALSSSRLIQLTTVRQPLREIGAEAVRLLAERIQQPMLAPREVVLAHHLVVRRSCGAELGLSRTWKGRSEVNIEA